MLDATVAPEAKFVPVSVTLTFAPGAPKFGLTEVNVGGRGLMVKTTTPVVPPEVVTLMFADPVALPAMDRVAVI